MGATSLGLVLLASYAHTSESSGMPDFLVGFSIGLLVVAEMVLLYLLGEDPHNGCRPG